MTDQQNALWDNYAEYYDALNLLRPYQKMYEEIVSILKTHNPRTILDAGCGTGNLLHYCKEYHYAKPHFTCIDFSDNMLLSAKEAGEGLVAHFEKADLNSDFLNDNRKFDMIVCINVSYIIKNIQNLVRSLHRLLNAGGILVLSNPKHDNHPGLILKEHCQSTKSDSYWMFDLSNAELTLERAREAFGENAHSMMDVVKSNIIIESISDFSYPSYEQWMLLFHEAGFGDVQHHLVYASQNNLFICHK